MALNYRVGQMTVQKQSTKKERLRLQFAKERVSKNKRDHLFPLGCNLSKNKRDHLFPLGCNLSKNKRGFNREGARGRALSPLSKSLWYSGRGTEQHLVTRRLKFAGECACPRAPVKVFMVKNSA